MSTSLAARVFTRCLFKHVTKLVSVQSPACITALRSASTSSPFMFPSVQSSSSKSAISPAESAEQRFHDEFDEFENINSAELLKRITLEYARNGKTFVLPWTDSDAMKLAVDPLQKLLDEGIRAIFLFDACVKREELFRAFIKQGPKLLAIIELLMSCTGQTYENTMRFIADWTEDLMCVTPESISNRLSVFLSRGVLSGLQISGVIKKCPFLLFASEPQKMDMVLETLAEFFPPDEMKDIMLNSPQVCLQDPEQLVLRYEYIYFHMAIEPAEFTECIRWHELPLEEIMARHEVLKRAGKYFLPDPKRPQFKMENPSMYRIFDTDDAEFAIQVAGIRREEWALFRQLFDKEHAQIDLERPYERVKPSLRKMYARKKAAAERAPLVGTGESDELF